MSLRECGWCEGDNPPEPMVSGHEMPFVCSKCGSNLGYLGWRGLSKMLGKLYKEIKELKETYNVS